MSGRRPLIAANWKMNTTLDGARTLALATSDALSSDDLRQAEVVICPPAISLAAVHEVLGDRIQVGAQNMHWQESGAYTGEISAQMLQGICSYVIVGHSERRQGLGETDEMVHRKVRAALRAGLRPIICVGETQEQRERGLTHAWIELQVRAALFNASSDDLGQISMAYEPIWAIGTGRAASGEDANRVGGLIRRALAEICGRAAAEGVRIQYGGSVSPGNAREFLCQPEIDGALVGGASLQPEAFAGIVRATH